MTVYRTCRNCAHEREPCQQRENVRASLKGLGMTSVKFRCPDREPRFRRGQRVSVTWPVPDDSGYDMPTLETWPATVIRESGARFLVLIDDTDSDHETPATEYVKNPTLFARPAPNCVRPIDEPDVTLCMACDHAPDHPRRYCAEQERAYWDIHCPNRREELPA